MKNIVLLVCFTLNFISCTNNDIDRGIPINEKYELKYPSYFPSLTFDTIRYPLSKNGIELGRKLFYDGRLSRNNTISCGFCHIQENAFTHHGHNVSHGIDDRLGIRNAPAIQNLAFLNRFMWDGVIHDLAQQSISPISNEDEMDSSIEEIVSKLKNDTNYRTLFKSVFGDENINGERILNALGQFMAAMISSNSRYDAFLKKEGNLTDEEKYGMNLFQQKCSSCHNGALFTDETFRNTGQYYDAQYKDGGRFRVTLDSVDFMKFRVPSLRNIELTKPYMHDGRFYSLEAVLNFYDQNVENQKNLDPILKQNGRIGIPMTENEKKAIITFLKTLTDQKFITNPAFAEFN
ncbi:cytochrome c peroxidase [Algoriella xinjiangensis]|uniref:Cytochrome c peroxidase n=1 Tax=Algoriella xinjiangensis TaxID=684065 RepID=A0A1I4Z0T5_9FLAO|nr:cytochrome c peroxidase [Algoriella xinjiangensis]SFN43872.1 cytochrome c peroxidase [Algoriella xinjiangensis]VDH16617.1 Cytochrome c551 peroxidase precursor [Algoriella xinjiangensis]